MKSALINHCKLSVHSAAAYLGVPEEEIYRLYNGKPPVFISLAELHKFAGDKIKSGEHNAIWFNSEAAQCDPILVHDIDRLLDIIHIAELCDDFRALAPAKLTIGSALETLRIIVNKYEHFTGPLYDFVEYLSGKGFFEIV